MSVIDILERDRRVHKYIVDHGPCVDADVVRHFCMEYDRDQVFCSITALRACGRITTCWIRDSKHAGVTNPHLVARDADVYRDTLKAKVVEPKITPTSDGRGYQCVVTISAPAPASKPEPLSNERAAARARDAIFALIADSDRVWQRNQAHHPSGSLRKITFRSNVGDGRQFECVVTLSASVPEVATLE